ncbi:MAG: S-layer protein, partial [Planctomyces sp.]|nr:S-layer protein [Planctomyces sp.]
YLDIIGRAPTAAEARAFLTDSSADKRTRLIDTLLDQPEYAEFWASKWADLLRPNPYRVGIKAVLNYDNWIRESFRENKPYDEFVRELITAQGSTFRNGAVTLYRDRRTPDEITTMVGQLFLGIRLDCARCHHHPFEIWGQEDFYSFAAYFARIKHKGTGLSPPISGSEEMVYDGPTGEVQHPLTNETLAPKPLFGEAPEINDETSRRESLAVWMTSKENPYFAQTMANRVWADLMGRGMVEPVDDLRGTNPAVNQELLTALAKDFVEHDFNIKDLVRRICNSYAYGLSSHPVERNMVDTRNYSRFYRQRLRAEVLFDSIAQATGVKDKFQAMPAGVTSKELWTTRIDSLFLDAFGRPDPNQDPPCERTTDTTIVQALHLMNSEDLYKKVTSDEGNAAKLAASDKTYEQITEELYLSIYSRFPTAEEMEVARSIYTAEGADRRKVTEDLMWAMLNTPEFVFKD